MDRHDRWARYELIAKLAATAAKAAYTIAKAIEELSRIHW
jgi:hypothetical protein